MTPRSTTTAPQLRRSFGGGSAAPATAATTVVTTTKTDADTATATAAAAVAAPAPPSISNGYGNGYDYGGGVSGDYDGRITVACRVKPRLVGDAGRGDLDASSNGNGNGGGAAAAAAAAATGGAALRWTGSRGTMKSPACVSVGSDEKTVAWAGERADGVGAKHFTFDYAGGEGVTQDELFEKVSEE